MTVCPDCGRENVSDPMGFVTHCGRRIQGWQGNEGWQERRRMDGSDNTSTNSSHEE